MAPKDSHTYRYGGGTVKPTTRGTCTYEGTFFLDWLGPPGKLGLNNAKSHSTFHG